MENRVIVVSGGNRDLGLGIVGYSFSLLYNYNWLSQTIAQV